MLKKLFMVSTKNQSIAAMMVTSHDINFVMGLIKEEEKFSSSNASLPAGDKARPIVNVSTSL